MRRKIETQSSVGSNSPSPSLSSSSSSLSFIDDSRGAQQQQQQQQPYVKKKKNKEEDACFRCKQKGHWAYQCPKNTLNTTTTTITEDGGESVDLMCPCGAGSCNIVTSNTPKNPNRKYYRCPLSGGKGCSTFIKWCDDVFLITGSPPPCPCHAGPCSVIIHHHHPHHQQPSYSFVCPIKKGHGACNFIQPVYSHNHSQVEGNVNTPFSPKSTLTHCFSSEETTITNTSRPSSSSISSISTDKICASVSSVSLAPPNQHPTLQLDDSICEIPRDDKMRKGINFHKQQQEDDDEETCIHLHHHHRARKRLRDWSPKQNDDSFLNHDSGLGFRVSEEEEPCKDTLAIQTSPSLLIIPDEVLVRPQQQGQAQFFHEISSTNFALSSSPTACVYGSSTLVQNCLHPNVVYHEMLGFQFEGWCGRLLFPPSRSLTLPAPRPFFCCVFPCFDPIFVPGDDYTFGTKSIKLSTPLLGGDVKVGPSEGVSVVQVPPYKISPGNNNNNNNNINSSNNIMRLSIIDVFKQAATQLEEGLVNILESMEPQEHKSMVNEANLVFDALDNLSVVDYSSFKERVLGFIDCAVSVSELQSSSSSVIITSQGSYFQQKEQEEEDVVDTYRHLQVELEGLSIKCSEASVALTASDNRLNVLTQEEDRIKEMLSNIQVEILCCREENEEINSQLEKLTRDKEKSEMSVEVAKEQVERVHREAQQREALVDVAITSFEKARSKLREK